MPFLKHDLRLLDGYLEEMARTPYFSDELNTYIADLRRTTAALLQQFGSIPEDATRQIIAQIWTASKYLTGSVSKEIPYEVVYALHLALDDWKAQLPRPYVITTALVTEQDYHFLHLSPDFYTLTQAFLKITFSVDLIQIAMPRLYRHLPLYMTPLYHELGHFIESYHQIVSRSLLAFEPGKHPTIPPVLGAPPPAPSQLGTFNEIHARHRKEYFADLFGASYTGRAFSSFLSELAAKNRATYTHPATQDRLRNIDDFLAGRNNPIIDMFQQVLTSLRMPPLKLRYTSPVIRDAFNNIRPYTLVDDGEVHGLLDAGAALLQTAESRSSAPWSSLEEAEIPRIINDLIEKSIRNRIISVRWRSGITR